MLYRRDSSHGQAAAVSPVEEPELALVEPELALVPVEAGQRRKQRGGATRKAWERFCVEKVELGEGLRGATRRWLKEKGIVHKPLSTSSNKGKACLLATCAECRGCTRQFCFSIESGRDLLVERFGECSDIKDGCLIDA